MIYWGQKSRSYSGSERIESPGTTRWVPTLPSGEDLFALSALDGNGNESAYSNGSRKIVP